MHFGFCLRDESFFGKVGVCCLNSVALLVAGFELCGVGLRCVSKDAVILVGYCQDWWCVWC